MEKFTAKEKIFFKDKDYFEFENGRTGVVYEVSKDDPEYALVYFKGIKGGHDGRYGRDHLINPPKEGSHTYWWVHISEAELPKEK